MNLVEISLIVLKILVVEIGKILACVNNTLVVCTTFLAAQHTTVCMNRCNEIFSVTGACGRGTSQGY